MCVNSLECTRNLKFVRRIFPGFTVTISVDSLIVNSFFVRKHKKNC